MKRAARRTIGPKKSATKRTLSAAKVLSLLREGRAARRDLERDYARLQQITTEDLQFTSR